MKAFIKVVVILIIATIFINTFFNNRDGSSNIVEDDLTYSLPWKRATYGKEFTEISKLLVANRVKDCAEFYVKRVREGEYVVACTMDGAIWKYYVAWPGIDELYLANDQMESRLTPPR